MHFINRKISDELCTSGDSHPPSTNPGSATRAIGYVVSLRTSHHHDAISLTSVTLATDEEHQKCQNLQEVRLHMQDYTTCIIEDTR